MFSFTVQLQVDPQPTVTWSCPLRTSGRADGTEDDSCIHRQQQSASAADPSQASGGEQDDPHILCCISRTRSVSIDWCDSTTILCCPPCACGCLLQRIYMDYALLRILANLWNCLPVAAWWQWQDLLDACWGQQEMKHPVCCQRHALLRATVEEIYWACAVEAPTTNRGHPAGLHQVHAVERSNEENVWRRRTTWQQPGRTGNKEQLWMKAAWSLCVHYCKIQMPMIPLTRVKTVSQGMDQPGGRKQKLQQTQQRHHHHPVQLHLLQASTTFAHTAVDSLQNGSGLQEAHCRDTSSSSFLLQLAEMFPHIPVSKPTLYTHQEAWYQRSKPSCGRKRPIQWCGCSSGLIKMQECVIWNRALLRCMWQVLLTGRCPSSAHRHPASPRHQEAFHMWEVWKTIPAS